MKSNTSESPFYRIVALWAFSEAFLGGMLHGLHLPVTGLVLGSFAVICLSALATQTKGKGRFLKATILVLLVKAILSPHSPPTAYLAVLLQGLFAELTFGLPIPYRIQTVVLGIFALVESAFQRLIVLTVLFGNELWSAFDEFSNSVLKSLGLKEVTYSFYLVSVYVLFHFLAGILSGYFAGKLPDWLSKPIPEVEYSIDFQTIKSEEISSKSRKNRLLSPLSLLIFALLLFALYDIYSSKSVILTLKSKPLKLLLRSVLVLCVWYFYVTPALLLLFRKWVENQKSVRAKELELILNLVPEMKQIVIFCWQKSRSNRGISRISLFLKLTFYTSLNPNGDL